MRRLLLYLPLCLLMAPAGMRNALPQANSALADVADDGDALPTPERMKQLAQTEPIALLEACIRRYDREVKGYHCTLHKQERIDGVLQPSEEIACDFREEPFSVRMEWKQGAGLAEATVYAKGENKDKILVKGTGLLALAGVVERDVDGPDAKKSSRYPIDEFGIKVGMERALASWKQARKDDAIHIEFLGEVKVKEAGGRVCWKLRRTGYKAPEDNGVAESTFYYDAETWLQVGSTLKNKDGQLLGEYWFYDLQLNPDFKADTFTREGLTK
jgi:hypothetical protein